MTQNLQEHIIDQEKALEFILGGNSIFTVRKVVDQSRKTFKVYKSKKYADKFRVYVLTGPDNTKSYTEIGLITMDELKNVRFEAHNYLGNKDYITLFERIFMSFSIGLVMPSIEMWHSGRCCRCGRVLTVPESIAAGIGPECAFKTSYLHIDYDAMASGGEDDYEDGEEF